MTKSEDTRLRNLREKKTFEPLDASEKKHLKRLTLLKENEICPDDIPADQTGAG